MVIAIVAGLLLLWLALLIALAVTRPADLRISDMLRLLPDTVILLRRLAADPNVPRGVRIRLVLLLVYLVLPDRRDPGLHPGPGLRRRRDHLGGRAALGPQQVTAASGRRTGCRRVKVGVVPRIAGCAGV